MTDVNQVFLILDRHHIYMRRNYLVCYIIDVFARGENELCVFLCTHMSRDISWIRNEIISQCVMTMSEKPNNERIKRKAGDKALLCYKVKRVKKVNYLLSR